MWFTLEDQLIIPHLGWTVTDFPSKLIFSSRVMQSLSSQKKKVPLRNNHIDAKGITTPLQTPQTLCYLRGKCLTYAFIVKCIYSDRIDSTVRAFWESMLHGVKASFYPVSSQSEISLSKLLYDDSLFE